MIDYLDHTRLAEFFLHSNNTQSLVTQPTYVQSPLSPTMVPLHLVDGMAVDYRLYVAAEYTSYVAAEYKTYVASEYKSYTAAQYRSYVAARSTIVTALQAAIRRRSPASH